MPHKSNLRQISIEKLAANGPHIKVAKPRTDEGTKN